MPTRPSTSRNVPRDPMGMEWEQGAQPDPNGQFSFRIDREMQANADEAALRDMFRRAREAAALDVYALASDLGEPLTYASKISEAENGVRGRHIQLRWVARLMQYPAALEVIVAYFCRRAGKKMPEPAKAMTRQEAQADALDVLAQLDGMKDFIKAAIAKKRGVRPDEVPL